MSFFNDTKVLVKRLSDQMTTNHATVPMQLPGDIKTPSANLWVQAVVRAGGTNQVSMGNPAIFRTAGIMIIAIMSKPDTGNGDALNLADDIASYFRKYKNGGLRCRAPTVEDLGLSGAWYQVNVLVPYQSDSFF